MKHSELAIIEKLLLEISSPPAQAPINDTFKNLRDYNELERYQMLVQGFAHMRAITMNDSESGHSAVAGILFGVLLSEVSSDPHIENAIKTFVEIKQKERGEHVVDFNKWRAGKK